MQLEDDYVEDLRKQIPALPWQVKQRLLTEYELSPYDAQLISEEKATADFFSTTNE